MSGNAIMDAAAPLTLLSVAVAQVYLWLRYL